MELRHFHSIHYAGTPVHDGAVLLSPLIGVLGFRVSRRGRAHVSMQTWLPYVGRDQILWVKDWPQSGFVATVQLWVRAREEGALQASHIHTENSSAYLIDYLFELLHGSELSPVYL